MQVLNNFLAIKSKIVRQSFNTKLVVVTKNQQIDNINPLIQANHFDFGENRVQEAFLKWRNLIQINSKLKLHLIGKLQSNKAKDAFEIFHYIHTLDNEKLAKIFANCENNSLKKIKYFIQVNIGDEPQKNGISIHEASMFIKYCIYDLKLNIIGLMCIPPSSLDPSQYFKNLAKIAKKNSLNELSMGMSSDYECAINYGSTYVRVGSKIFS